MKWDDSAPRLLSDELEKNCESVKMHGRGRKEEVNQWIEPCVWPPPVYEGRLRCTN